MSANWADQFRRYRLVHLGFNPQKTLAILVRKPIEDYLTGLGGNWYRYAPQSYVIWTNKELAALTREITSIPGCNSLYVLATAFTHDLENCNGMMPKPFWEWLQQFPRSFF